jgi:hypothetical protein
MSMPGSTFVQHALGILLLPTIFTMHSPHAAVGSKSLCLHSVGILTFTASAASKIVVPSETVTSIPFIFAATMTITSSHDVKQSAPLCNF